MKSRKLNILNGPSFRSFVLNSHLLAERAGFDFTLTMDQDVPRKLGTTAKDNPRLFQLALRALGRNSSLNNDEFSFIATTWGEMCKRSPSKTFKKPYWCHARWYYVGIYNVETRKGFCIEISDERLLTRLFMTHFLGQ